LSYRLFLTKCNAVDGPMTHSDLHAFILTSKVVDHSIMLFTGICCCGVDTRKQFFQQFARLAQRNLLVLGLADRTDTVVLRLALAVGRETQLAQRDVYFSQLLMYRAIKKPKL